MRQSSASPTRLCTWADATYSTLVALASVLEASYAGDDPRLDRRYASIVAAFSRAFAEGGRYMDKRCSIVHEPPTNTVLRDILSPYLKRQQEIRDGNIQFPIRDCTYESMGKKARVIMMNPMRTE